LNDIEVDTRQVDRREEEEDGEREMEVEMSVRLSSICEEVRG
jgi:hypothetical protein